MIPDVFITISNGRLNSACAFAPFLYPAVPDTPAKTDRVADPVVFTARIQLLSLSAIYSVVSALFKRRPLAVEFAGRLTSVLTVHVAVAPLIVFTALRIQLLAVSEI